MKTLAKALLLLSLLAGAPGCAGNKDKGINRDKDKPKPPGNAAQIKKGASLESSPKQRTLSPGLAC